MYRIFIVEDDAGLAQAMKKQIASWGNEVFCAEDFSDIIPAFVACRAPYGADGYHAALL